MLVSIHMPKTAGLSFRTTLEQHYGEGFRHDYADYPLASPLPQRHAAALEYSLAAEPAAYADVACIHGHFLPIKYLLLADSMECRFVTWLREPVQRLVSHYYYWQRSYDPVAEDTSSLHRRVVEEQWTLEQFCLAPELRNVYSQFLWAFPLRALDFVGITEYFAEDLREFATLFLGINVEPQFANAADVPAGPEKLPPKLLRQVQEYHAQDLSLYQWALQQRAARHQARA